MIIISVVYAKGKAFAEEPRGVLVVGMALEADGKDEDRVKKIASMFVFRISLQFVIAKSSACSEILSSYLFGSLQVFMLAF